MTHPGGVVAQPLFITDDPRKWIRAARKLHEMIQAGELKPGDQLPGRALLTASMGVSRGTLARAIRDLEACGVLCHGRSGPTWVPAPVAAEPVAAGQPMMLTVAECAVAAGVCNPVIYRLIHDGAVRGRNPRREAVQGL